MVIDQHGELTHFLEQIAETLSQIEIPCAVCGSVTTADGRLECLEDCPTDVFGNA
jgi:hypothetical protein